MECNKDEGTFWLPDSTRCMDHAQKLNAEYSMGQGARIKQASGIKLGMHIAASFNTSS
jgi:hypothetical protein